MCPDCGKDHEPIEAQRAQAVLNWIANATLQQNLFVAEMVDVTTGKMAWVVSTKVGEETYMQLAVVIADEDLQRYKLPGHETEKGPVMVVDEDGSIARLQ